MIMVYNFHSMTKGRFTQVTLAAFFHLLEDEEDTVKGTL